MGLFSGILMCLADSMLKDLSKKDTRVGRSINTLNTKAQEFINEVEEEKNKMYSYTEDELLHESKRGKMAHMIAAKTLLKELYGYNY